MTLDGLVESGGINFAIQRTAHVGDFLGPLVHQQQHEGGLGVVDANVASEGLEEDGLAGTRRGGDQTTLAHANRREQIDSPGTDLGIDGSF